MANIALSGSVEAQQSLLARVCHAQDVQEAAEIEDFAYRLLNSAQYEQPRRLSQSLRGNQHHAQSGAGDIVELAQVQQQLIRSLADMPQDLGLGLCGVAAIELALQTDDEDVPECFVLAGHISRIRAVQRLCTTRTDRARVVRASVGRNGRGSIAIHGQIRRG